VIPIIFHLLTLEGDTVNRGDLITWDHNIERWIVKDSTGTNEYPIEGAGQRILFTLEESGGNYHLELYNVSSQLIAQGDTYIDYTLVNGQSYTVKVAGSSGSYTFTAKPFYSGLVEKNLIVQNQTIVTDHISLAKNTLTAGPAFTVESGAQTSFVSGDTIMLTDGFWAKNGCEFNASIDPQLDTGGSLPKVSNNSNINVSQSQEQKEIDELTTEQSDIPVEFTLSPNYPNPCNPSTTFPYALPEARHVRLVIYNMIGQRVKTLIDEYKDAGCWSADWDCRDDRDRQLSTGIYVCVFEAGEFMQSRKLILIR
jgi:hypothetical protein